MAHRQTPPDISQKAEDLDSDNDSDRDSGVGDDAVEEADSCHKYSATEGDEVKEAAGMEENGVKDEDSTVFVAFQGNMNDEDFAQKLDSVLSGIPNVLNMG